MSAQHITNINYYYYSTTSTTRSNTITTIFRYSSTRLLFQVMAVPEVNIRELLAGCPSCHPSNSINALVYGYNINAFAVLSVLNVVYFCYLVPHCHACPTSASINRNTKYRDKNAWAAETHTADLVHQNVYVRLEVPILGGWRLQSHH